MNRYEVVMRSGRVYNITAENWKSMLDGKLLLFIDEDDHTVRAFSVDAVETWGDA